VTPRWATFRECASIRTKSHPAASNKQTKKKKTKEVETMLKRIGLPVFVLLAILMIAAPAPASAKVHFGVYVGPQYYPAPYYTYPPYYTYQPYSNYGYYGVVPYSSYYYRVPEYRYRYPAYRYRAPEHRYRGNEHRERNNNHGHRR